MTTLTRLCLALLMIASATQVYRMNPGTAAPARTEITHHFFVSGIGQTKTVNAARVCGGTEKVVEVEARESFSGRKRAAPRSIRS